MCTTFPIAPGTNFWITPQIKALFMLRTEMTIIFSPTKLKNCHSENSVNKTLIQAITKSCTGYIGKLAKNLPMILILTLINKFQLIDEYNYFSAIHTCNEGANNIGFVFQ